jgi:hypothetical protein
MQPQNPAPSDAFRVTFTREAAVLGDASVSRCETLNIVPGYGWESSDIELGLYGSVRVITRDTKSQERAEVNLVAANTEAGARQMSSAIVDYVARLSYRCGSQSRQESREILDRIAGAIAGAIAELDRADAQQAATTAGA